MCLGGWSIEGKNKHSPTIWADTLDLNISFAAPCLWAFLSCHFSLQKVIFQDKIFILSNVRRTNSTAIFPALSCSFFSPRGCLWSFHLSPPLPPPQVQTTGKWMLVIVIISDLQRTSQLQCYIFNSLSFFFAISSLNSSFNLLVHDVIYRSNLLSVLAGIHSTDLHGK